MPLTVDAERVDTHGNQNDEVPGRVDTKEKEN